MTLDTPPAPGDWSPRSAALALLVEMGLVGNVLSGRMAAAIGDPDLVRNLPLAVLADLSVHGRRRPAEIQQLSGMTSGGVTKLLDRLEQRGLVTRGFGMVPGDRRAIVVELTPRGHATAEAIADGLLEHVADIRAALREATVLLDRIEAAGAG